MSGRRTIATAVGVTVGAALALVLPGVASADHHVTCSFVDGKVVCVGDDPGDPAPPPPEVPPDDPESPYYYTTEPAIGPCPGPGEVYTWIHTHLRATGEIVSSSAVCLGPTDPPAPVPPPPPPPPTRDEFIRDIDDLLQLDTGLSPDAAVGGVSQLDTWFWCDNAGDVTVDVTLNGWRATATAYITRLIWTIEGPDGQVQAAADSCGSEPDPSSDGESAAATWTPNEPGDSTITLTAEWGGTWTRSFGGVSETFDLGTVSIVGSSIGYSVVEIQTVGVDNR